MSETKAIYPYNFVPFGPDPVRQSYSAWFPGKKEPLQNGWLNVDVCLKSPLIIPDGSRYATDKPDNTPPEVLLTDEKGENVHKIYKFLRTPDGQFTIPGSELRGMIRSVYEAASNSCLPFLLEDRPEDTPITQRTQVYAAFPNRGLLEYARDEQTGKWFWRLYQAGSVRTKETKGHDVATGTYKGPGTNKEHRNGDKEHRNGDYVTYEVGENGEPILDSGERKGYLQFNIPINRDNPYHVAVLWPKKVEKKWDSGDDSPYTALYDAVKDTTIKKQYAEQTQKKTPVTTQDDLLRALEAVKEHGGMVPVWYIAVKTKDPSSGKVENLYYLSGASIGRVRQRRTWLEIMGSHSPCTKLSAVCPACALFGTTNAEDDITPEQQRQLRGVGARGRVRFTDAVSGYDGFRAESHTLQILASPHPSAFEFYLDRPELDAYTREQFEKARPDDVLYWNYDYFGLKNPDKKIDYAHLPAATPRGRKFYLHSDKTQADLSEKTKMNATMESIDCAEKDRDKPVFSFRVYFDGITAEQLNQLIWVLTLGDNNPNSRFQHKLGHAKPLGYGSVKLVVRECVKRTVTGGPNGAFSMKMETEPVSKTPACPFPEKSDYIQAILNLTDSSITRGFEVKYLTGEGKDGTYNVFDWFSINRTNPAKNLKTLPKPFTSDGSGRVTGETLSLPDKRPKP